MKFGKLLQRFALESPEHANLVLRFKELKKQLKLIQPAEDVEAGLGEATEPRPAEPDRGDAIRSIPAEHQATPRDAEGNAGNAAAEAAPLSSEERAFIQTLKEDIQKFNAFFMDSEEDAIIRMGVLEDNMAKETDPTRLTALRKQFADLHGSLILLLHWSSLNYTAVAKILKKHDKRTGVLLRQPVLASLVKQPFTSTERITELIKKAEAHSQALLDREGDSQPAGEGQQDSEQAVDELREQHAELVKRTKAAIDVWEEMRATAVTPSTVVPTQPAAKKRKLESDDQAKPSTAAGSKS